MDAATFWTKVDQSGECWLWTGERTSQGYGLVRVSSTPRRRTFAHRFAYEQIVGPVPADRTLDHICHGADTSCLGGPTCAHRRCVNALHLEPVTSRVNTLRGRGLSARNAIKTHCKRGHELIAANITWRHLGPTRRPVRVCRACNRARLRAARLQSLGL